MASATATTRRTAGSAGCAAWSPRSSPRRCCTATCTPTARTSGCGRLGPHRRVQRHRVAPARLEPGAGLAELLAGRRHAVTPAFPRADVENDFLRVRRRQVLARLAQRLRREPDDVNLILPFDEVVAALGCEGERSLGLQTIRLDSIVGTVDSRPRLRPPVPAHLGPGPGAVGAAGPGPAPGRVDPADRRVPGRRPALRAGRPPPGVDRDGDRARRRSTPTSPRCSPSCPAEGIRRRGDLLIKSYERMFRARVPLPDAGLRQDRRHATRGRTPSWARPSRPGASGACSTSTGSATGPRSPAGGSPTSTRPVVRMLRERRPGRRRHRGRGLPARRRRAVPADPHPRVERRGHRAAAAKVRSASPLGRRRDGPDVGGRGARVGSAGRRVRLAASPGRAVCTEAASSRVAARVRLWPVAGSKTCIARASTQSSASSPSVIRVAASSRATIWSRRRRRCRRGPSPGPAPRARRISRRPALDA